MSISMKTHCLLHSHLESIKEYLQSIRLKLHEYKSKIYCIRNGINFLGYKLFLNVVQLKRENVRRFRLRLRKIPMMGLVV